MFYFAKVLQAVGFADVGLGLYLGMVRDDMWKELYLTLAGLGFFFVGRLLERRA
ncbi:MAG TPA: hypothetical protein VMS22_25695 [Candidatus Eisenbacteria bacterium]|nr:hypothetical protein [Candidatus Eisenbacteria bacterium]